MATLSSVGTSPTYAAEYMRSAAMIDAGGTFDPETGKRVSLSNGYMVGIGTGLYGKAISLTATEMYSDAGIAAINAVRADALNITRDYAALAGNADGIWFVGAWRDNVSGEYVWEVSQNFATYDVAIRFASLRDEYSIWDNANGREIVVP